MNYSLYEVAVENGHRVGWVNQSDSWDVEYGDGVVRSSRGPHVVAFSKALEDGQAFDELPGNYIAGWQFRSEYFVLLKSVPKVAFRHRFISGQHPRGYALTRRGSVNQG